MPESVVDRRSPQGVLYTDLQHIVNADGQHLFCRYFEPDGSPRALVFVVHGAGEHSGPYSDLAKTLTGLGLFVFSHDHVGHGQSEGERMVIGDFHIYIRDSLQHIDLMKGRYPNLPIFIIGHSMGGAISILTACERPDDFAGVVLIAPLVQMSPESASPIKVFVAKMLNTLMPSITLGSINSLWISRDPKQVEAYDKDELNHHGGLRVSFGMQLLAATQQIEKVLPDIAWPFLLLHGDADKLCHIGGSKLMMEKSKSSDKKLKKYKFLEPTDVKPSMWSVFTGRIVRSLSLFIRSNHMQVLRVYEGAYHALHHEIPEVADLVRQEVTSWITERIPGEQASSP